MEEKNIRCLRVGDIETNCWIYPLSPGPHDPPGSGEKPGTDGALCAVIDPGDEAPLIIDHLRKMCLCPKYILLTHGHFDHLMALPELAKVFPGAVIAIHGDDAPYLGAGALAAHRASLAAVFRGSPFLPDLPFTALPEANLLLSDGDRVGSFTVIHLPGHTPGSAAFYDEGAGILFTGDTLFKGDCGRTDLPGGDKISIGKSLKRLFGMDGAIQVLPGHGPETTIGAERGYFAG